MLGGKYIEIIIGLPVFNSSQGVFRLWLVNVLGCLDGLVVRVCLAGLRIEVEVARLEHLGLINGVVGGKLLGCVRELLLLLLDAEHHLQI